MTCWDFAMKVYNAITERIFCVHYLKPQDVTSPNIIEAKPHVVPVIVGI